MKIIHLSGNDCGGFRPPEGHLDTQMFPECENTETDRNIVKKTVERRNKKKKKASIEGINVEESHSSNWYKRAKIDFPELDGEEIARQHKQKFLYPPLKEKIIQKFKEEHPNISATLEEIWDWYRRNFTMLPAKPYDWEKHRQRDMERDVRELQERANQ